MCATRNISLIRHSLAEIVNTKKNVFLKQNKNKHEKLILNRFNEIMNILIVYRKLIKSVLFFTVKFW